MMKTVMMMEGLVAMVMVMGEVEVEVVVVVVSGALAVSHGVRPRRRLLSTASTNIPLIVHCFWHTIIAHHTRRFIY